MSFISDHSDPTSWDFRELLTAPRETLIAELADAHTNLAVLHEEIAYLRVQEKMKQIDGTERISREGTRDAYIEKKFLLIRLLDERTRDT